MAPTVIIQIEWTGSLGGPIVPGGRVLATAGGSGLAAIRRSQEDVTVELVALEAGVDPDTENAIQ